MDSPKSNSATKTVVGSCLQCGGLVRIPVDADPHSTVRCPRCSEMFSLGDVLDQAAPTMELVNLPEQPMVQTDEETEIANYNPESGKFEVPSVLRRGARGKRRKRSRKGKGKSRSSSEKDSRMDLTWKKRSDRKKSDDTGLGSLSDEATVADGDTSIDNLAVSVAASDSKRPSQSKSKRELDTDRRRRQSSKSSGTKRKKRSSSSYGKSRSPGFEFIKIVVGAFLALPVAQIMIWWLVGTDPLNFGPITSTVIPAIVPEKFHDPDVKKQDDEQPNDSAASEEKPSDNVVLPKPKSNPDDVDIN